MRSVNICALSMLMYSPPRPAPFQFTALNCVLVRTQAAECFFYRRTDYESCTVQEASIRWEVL